MTMWVCVFSKSGMCVPEIRCGGPFQGQASQIHSSIHQQEENGHNAGDGVELPREQHQLDRKSEPKKRRGKEGERKRWGLTFTATHRSKVRQQSILMPFAHDLHQHTPTPYS